MPDETGQTTMCATGMLKAPRVVLLLDACSRSLGATSATAWLLVAVAVEYASQRIAMSVPWVLIGWLLACLLCSHRDGR